MARLAKFSADRIIDATAGIAADRGPATATMARIAAALGAPTGSIYHRFASRDVLLGEVWLRAAAAFQDAFSALLEGPDPWDAGLAAALSVPARVREHPDEARILMLHRREDFLAADWPAELAERAVGLQKQTDSALRTFARRLAGRADAATLRALRYALVDAPLAAVLPHLRAGEPPPASIDSLIAATYLAVVPLAGTPHKRRIP
jgi:AcrR family transcriptional regulator